MAILCRELQLLFIQVPSTGCSVIAEVLLDEFGGEVIPEEPVWKGGAMVVETKHSSLPELLEHGVLSEEEVGRYLVVATVRNPLDTIATYYQRRVGPWLDSFYGWSLRDLERRRPDLSRADYEAERALFLKRQRTEKRRSRTMKALGFNAWLALTLSRTREGKMRDAARGYAMLRGVDAVIRYERLEEGLNHVLHALGVERRVSLPQVNVTPGKRPFSSYYSPLAKRLAGRVLRRELDAFGYGFERNEAAPPVAVLSDKPLARALRSHLSTASRS